MLNCKANARSLRASRKEKFDFRHARLSALIEYGALELIALAGFVAIDCLDNSKRLIVEKVFDV